MTREVVLALSSLEVTVAFDGAEQAERTLRSVWAHALTTRYRAISHRVKYGVTLAEGGFVVTSEACGRSFVDDEHNVMPALEDALYADLARTQRADELTMLHGACVSHAGRPIVFLGASGAGKSAMARAAVQAGLAYFCDEHVLTDGALVWGIPRMIHMDPHPFDAPPLPWHAGADLSSYRFRTHGGSWLRQPLYRVPDESVAEAPAPLARAVLVVPERGSSDALTKLGALERLEAVRTGFFVSGQALRPIALAEHAYRLRWCDPSAALALLLARLDAS